LSCRSKNRASQFSRIHKHNIPRLTITFLPFDMTLDMTPELLEFSLSGKLAILIRTRVDYGHHLCTSCEASSDIY